MSNDLTAVVHVHSSYSHDGRDSLEDLREFGLAHGIKLIGMTDHAEDLKPAQYAAYIEHCGAVSDDRLRIVPGLEFRFKGYPGLHLLALGLMKWIEPAQPREFIDEAKKHSAFTIVAHPVLAGYHLPSEVEAGIDAIEVWNASYNTRYLPDPEAISLLHRVRSRRPEVVGIAGLDQHDSRNYRETRLTLLPDDMANPLAVLRGGRFINHGHTMSFDAAVSWGPLRLGLLKAARWGYDRVERLQDRTSRWLHDRRRGE
jgi:hypothetical protein